MPEISIIKLRACNVALSTAKITKYFVILQQI